MADVTIAMQDVRFGYDPGSWQLRIPSLQFGVERVTCVVGPNGSGKSTLLRIAAGILRPDAGSVRLGDDDVATLSRRGVARALGFLPQESPPLYDITVDEVAQMGRYAYSRGLGVLSVSDRRAIDAALEAVDMTSLRNRALSRLSGGERRRALVASVLAQAPEVLLLDEPTSALDIHHAVDLVRRLADFGSVGPAVVLVTHDINLAALFGERVLLLANGEIHADGPPQDVITTDLMHRAYGADVLVREHPENGGPMVVMRR